MADSLFSDLLTPVRNHLIETTATFWSDSEIYSHMFRGAKDLWRDVVNLKQEHYITVNNDGVTLPANSSYLSGVPEDVHKIYMIEPSDLTVNGNNHGLLFKPLPYNNNTFQLARSKDAIDPQNDTIYYDIFKAGAPVGAPQVVVAPQVTSVVKISFVYVPTLGTLASTDPIPIPGEADNAIIAWTVAYARAKEREDRSPDPSWLAAYSTEKAHLLESLGLRQYQEPSYVEAVWEEYW